MSDRFCKHGVLERFCPFCREKPRIDPTFMAVMDTTAFDDWLRDPDALLAEDQALAEQAQRESELAQQE
jgi:hypothetical protein